MSYNSIMKSDVEKITLKEFNEVLEKYADTITDTITSFLNNGIEDAIHEDERSVIIFSEDGYTIQLAPHGSFIPFGTLLKIYEELMGSVRSSEIYNSLELHLEKPDENKSIFTALVIPKYNSALFEGRKIEDIMIVTMENGLGFDNALVVVDEDFDE